MSESNRPAAYAPATRIAIAEQVIDHWVTGIMSHGDLQVDWRAAAHPLALVRDALGGEVDPEQLGIDPSISDHHERIRALAAEAPEMLVRVAPEIVALLEAKRVDPVVLLGAERQDDGTYELVLGTVAGRADTSEMPTFSDLGASLVPFQGGTIILRGFGCASCGNGHWAEDDPARRRPGGSSVPCPHCGQLTVIPEARDAG